MKIHQDVFVHEGILDCQIDQLIEYSQTDSEIRKFTSDTLRFADKKSFQHWQQQGRIIYTLSDSQKNLLGIVWFGQKKAPIDDIKANFTFAIRIYGSARGQGLAQEFMKITFDDFLKNKDKTLPTGFWLETSIDNLSAIHTYQKFGFYSVARKDGKNVMVLNLK